MFRPERLLGYRAAAARDNKTVSTKGALVAFADVC